MAKKQTEFKDISSKPVSPEDLKKFDWIVVTDRKPTIIEFEHNPGETMMMIPMPHQPEPRFEPSGSPMQVKAISLPFIVGTPVNAPFQLITVNVQQYEIRRPSKEYVQVFIDTFKTLTTIQRNPQAFKDAEIIMPNP